LAKRGAIRRNERSDVLAGIFSLATIAGLTATAIILPTMTGPPKLEYEFRISGEEDLSGVARGTPVLIAGLERGRVTGVDDRPGPDGRLSFIVGIEITPDPPLFPGATARFSRDPVSNQTSINFYDPGEPTQTRLPLAEGSEVSVGEGPADASVFLSSASRTALYDTTQRVIRATDTWPPLLGDARSRGDALMVEAAGLRDDLRATWPATLERMTALIERYSLISSELEKVLEELKVVRAAYDLTAQPFSTDNGEWATLRRTFAEAGQAWASATEEARAISPLFTRAQEQWQRVQTIVTAIRARARTLVDELGFREISADLILAAEEFARLLAEGTAAPWKVLLPSGTRSDRKLDALDDTMRTLLRGISEARAAEVALRKYRSLGGQAGQIGADEIVESIHQFNETMDRFSTMEHALWQWRTDLSPRGAAPQP